MKSTGWVIAALLCVVISLHAAEAKIQFDADARLRQVEYALQATHQGATVVGAKSRRHAVLVAYTPRTALLASPGRKIFRVSPRVLLTGAGLAFDVKQVANSAFEFASSHLQLYGSDMPCGRLATKLADMMHAQTTSTEGRPLAARMLLAGYDETNHASLFEVDPMGNLRSCKMMAVGMHSSNINASLLRAIKQRRLTENSSISAITETCIQALKAALNAGNNDDGGPQLCNADNVQMAIVGEGVEAHELEREQVASMLEGGEKAWDNIIASDEARAVRNKTPAEPVMSV